MRRIPLTPFHALPLILALALPAAAAPPPAFTLAQVVRLALAHNHTLRAERTFIAQAQDNQVTAGLRPNPVFDTDGLFLPPTHLNPSTLNNFSEFDVGGSYTFELGGKRAARRRAAGEQTAVVRSQVADAGRRLAFRVQRRFIQVLLAQSNLKFARRDLAGFQSVDAISRRQYQAGSISHGDLLKTRLQTLAFQRDVLAAQVELTQAELALRRLAGFSSLPAHYALIGRLAYHPLRRGLSRFEAQGLRRRPDLLAARRQVAAAGGGLHLAHANAVPDLTTTLDYTHLGGLNNISGYLTLPLPLFNWNQGNIARATSQITTARELLHAVTERALTSIRRAYALLQSDNQLVGLYLPASRPANRQPAAAAPGAGTPPAGGYLQIAQQSLAVSEYAYRRGAASLLDFLDAERSYRSVELAYRQALAAAMIARAQLFTAVAARTLP
jgi:cobalt-zinc-cadmium efflux system outer membrane protein